MHASATRPGFTFLVLACVAFAGCLGPDDAGEGGAAGNGPDNGAVPSEPAGLDAPVQEAAATWTAGTCDIVFLGALAGTDHAEIALLDEARGLPFSARFTPSVPAVEMGVSFFAGDAYLEEFASMDPEVAGLVPSEADAALFWSCGGAEITVAFVVAPLA